MNSPTSTIQSHNSQDHVLVHRILSVEPLGGGYDSIRINGELSFPQVVDERVGDLTEQSAVLVRRPNLEVRQEI